MSGHLSERTLNRWRLCTRPLRESHDKSESINPGGARTFGRAAVPAHDAANLPGDVRHVAHIVEGTVVAHRIGRHLAAGIAGRNHDDPGARSVHGGEPA